ncbi:hypothetical protein AV530_018834 [Patagioenas fasciata monilis]|uniref:Uncharacterized protein n=1 Tax=Patagioenas fasciata monilis TaxID=372326 RepID=A0A1V4JJN9_PATFA|nr:hypothetical protein AV530_018834 [Patagioenas fasciata monilis]
MTSDKMLARVLRNGRLLGKPGLCSVITPDTSGHIAGPGEPVFGRQVDDALVEKTTTRLEIQIHREKLKH